MCVCVCVCVCVSVEHSMGVWKSESLHRLPGLPSNNYQRLLADGVAGEHEGDRHDNKGGGERTGQYQDNKRNKHCVRLS